MKRTFGRINMCSTIAVYAASMDPITLGHLDVIERVAPLFDELVILVASDCRKNYLFSLDERVGMVRGSCISFSNVRVEASAGRYVVKHAAEINAQVIIRGIRGLKDLESERDLAETNRRICPEIQTLWVPCDPSLAHVSSSMVKTHIGVDKDWETQVAHLVPDIVMEKLKEKLMTRQAKHHWDRLMCSLGNPAGSEDVFLDLIGRYTEPQRHYHNLQHVVSMLNEYENISGNDDAVMLAIWFHDAIYDASSSYNELQSAGLAQDAIEALGLGSVFSDKVANLIMATKHEHVPDEHAAKILIDLDLMILGSARVDFDAYEKGIREEYLWVPKKMFAKKRIKVLQSFLARPTIYSTSYFLSRYEQSARENLAYAIAALKK